MILPGRGRQLAVAATPGTSLTWADVAQEANLRTARMAGMALTMRVTECRATPVATLVHAAQW
jgi:hypothetical protein